MRTLAIAAGATGFVSVALGAFGAHGVALSAEARSWWDTATLYALVHSAAALGVALSTRGDIVKLGGWAFVSGAVIFSGTLYAMALGAPRMLGAVTPIGGVAFLIGWALIIVAVLRQR